MSWTDLAMNGRILVVDDALENIQVLHQALQDEHQVLFALSGAKALEIARQQLPDLILLDAMMPGMDGYAVCAALRASHVLSDIPVIFVTALSHPEMKRGRWKRVRSTSSASPTMWPWCGLGCAPSSPSSASATPCGRSA